MKKTVCAIFLILAGVSVFAQTGLIKEIAGQVETKAPGSSSFVSAKVGDSLTENTIISTGFKSTALIEVGSAVLLVRPLTRLTLTEIQATSGIEMLNVSLQTGRVRVDLNPPAGSKASMSIASTIATCSVRGTSFEFDTRNLQVNNGNVVFKGTIGQAAPVSAGSIVSISQNGSAVNPITYGTAVLIPQSAVGVEPDTTPVVIPSGNEPAPVIPGVPGEPSEPSKPTDPGSPDNGKDDNLGIDVEFVP